MGDCKAVITFDDGTTGTWSLDDEDQALSAATLLTQHFGGASMLAADGTPDAAEPVHF